MIETSISYLTVSYGEKVKAYLKAGPGRCGGGGLDDYDKSCLYAQVLEIIDRCEDNMAGQEKALILIEYQRLICYT